MSIPGNYTGGPATYVRGRVANAGTSQNDFSQDACPEAVAAAEKKEAKKRLKAKKKVLKKK